MRGQSESWSWKKRLDADPAAEARNAMKAHIAVSNKAIPHLPVNSVVEAFKTNVFADKFNDLSSFAGRFWVTLRPRVN